MYFLLPCAVAPMLVLVRLGAPTSNAKSCFCSGGAPWMVTPISISHDERFTLVGDFCLVLARARETIFRVASGICVNVDAFPFFKKNSFLFFQR